MLIYVDQISERLVYTMDFVFEQHGLSARLTNDKMFFSDFAGVRLNYSVWPLEGVAQLEPASLLFEESIDPLLQVRKSSWNDRECLSFNEVSDPFAAVFYVLSRYEEYDAQQQDKHGRYEAQRSLLVRFKWVHYQIVERWIEAIVEVYFPDSLEVLKQNRTVNFVPTFDIDNTFAFKWKEGWRSWLSNAKDTLQRNAARKEFRKSVQNAVKKDPYDCFDYLKSIARRFPETRFFWLLGDFAEYDKNISWSDPRHQALIQEMGAEAHIGLHPSYASNTSERRLAEETDRLRGILDRPVTESRQHFLKLNIPHTYRKLIHLGFQRDFTMGFAEEPGFRAGTAHPFYFFDLSRNITTDYQIIPFVYMDGTLREYKKWTPEQAKMQIDELVKEVKTFGGTFCCIWHNETIAEAGSWGGWRSVFEYTAKQFA